MPYFETAEEWQRQSALLLQARPTTARIVSKYNIPNLESPKYKRRKVVKDGGEKPVEGAQEAPKTPRATLTLKTYCPESGVCLKYKTDRAAEVGRLVAGLGRLGRHMAALPEKTEAEILPEDVPMSDGGAAPTAISKEGHAAPAESKPQASAGGGGGGGGKKKKKGKK